MTMWVWEKGYDDRILCDSCIHNDPLTQCCGAEDCFGGDHYENQLTLLTEEQEDTI